MRAGDANDRYPELSAGQIDEIRNAVRIAVRSHAELASVCSRYIDRFGISYSELRRIADVPLPDYLAGVPADRDLTTTPETGPELTTEQKTALIDAHREALAAGRSATVQRKQLEGFAGRFGVRVYVLKRVLSADEWANRQLYAELRAAGKQSFATAEAQRKAAKARRKAEQALRDGSANKSRRKSRRSVWTVGGGLPGQGKRN